MTDKPWRERIPTAIAKAKDWFKQPGIIDVAVFVNEKGDAVYVTAGEVALADGLRQAAENLNAEFGGERWPPELIAFTEKIERLNHDASAT